MLAHSPRLARGARFGRSAHLENDAFGVRQATVRKGPLLKCAQSRASEWSCVHRPRVALISGRPLTIVSEPSATTMTERQNQSDRPYGALASFLAAQVPALRWAFCAERSTGMVLWSYPVSADAIRVAADARAFVARGGPPSAGSLILSKTEVQVYLGFGDDRFIGVCSHDVSRVGFIRSVVQHAVASSFAAQPRTGAGPIGTG